MPIGDVDPEEYFLKPEMDEMKKVFDQYDDDGSGAVSSDRALSTAQLSLFLGKTNRKMNRTNGLNSSSSVHVLLT